MGLSVSADTVTKAASLSHSHIIYTRYDLGFCLSSLVTIRRLYIIYIYLQIFMYGNIEITAGIY